MSASPGFVRPRSCSPSGCCSLARSPSSPGRPGPRNPDQASRPSDEPGLLWRADLCCQRRNADAAPDSRGSGPCPGARRPRGLRLPALLEAGPADHEPGPAAADDDRLLRRRSAPGRASHPGQQGRRRASRMGRLREPALRRHAHGRARRPRPRRPHGPALRVDGRAVAPDGQAAPEPGGPFVARPGHRRGRQGSRDRRHQPRLGACPGSGSGRLHDLRARAARGARRRPPGPPAHVRPDHGARLVRPSGAHRRRRRRCRAGDGLRLPDRHRSARRFDRAARHRQCRLRVARDRCRGAHRRRSRARHPRPALVRPRLVDRERRRPCADPGPGHVRGVADGRVRRGRGTGDAHGPPLRPTEASAWSVYQAVACRACPETWRQLWYDDVDSFRTKVGLASTRACAASASGRSATTAPIPSSGRRSAWRSARPATRRRPPEPRPWTRASIRHWPARRSRACRSCRAWLDLRSSRTTARRAAAAFVRVSDLADVADGQLVTGRTYPSLPSLDVSLTDPAIGGSTDTGKRTVYVQWRDVAGNWSRSCPCRSGTSERRPPRRLRRRHPSPSPASRLRRTEPRPLPLRSGNGYAPRMPGPALRGHIVLCTLEPLGVRTLEELDPARRARRRGRGEHRGAPAGDRRGPWRPDHRRKPAGRGLPARGRRRARTGRSS